VAVDGHGDLSLPDRSNHRICRCDKMGRYVETFFVDATISPSNRKEILAHPTVLRGQERTTLDIQKRLRGPMSVRLVGDLRYVPDSGSHRIRVYKGKRRS